MKKSKLFLYLTVTAVLVAAVIVFFLIFLQKEDSVQRFADLMDKEGIEKPNIILITLDTTRADHLPCYGYSGVKTPYLDDLAREGIVFEQCTTSSPLTLPSHTSIMTGLYPTYHGVRVNGNTAVSQKLLTLAELFSQQGYQCGAFIASFILDGRWGLNQGFHHYDDQLELEKYHEANLGLIQRPGNEVVDAALSWLEGQSSSPFFAWIHLYDPHTPYEPPEPYLAEYSTKQFGLYDGEIAFMDEQIGRVVSWLKEKELTGKTLIALMGDHGEGLGDHGELEHGYFIYDYAVQVPFLIVTPFKEFREKRVSSQVRTVDLYPTLLEMAGVEVPKENQGESLLDMLFHPDKSVESYAYCESFTPNIHYNWSPLCGLKTPRYKYIEAPRAELYDLEKDPGELTNIIEISPRIAGKLKKALDRMIEQTSLEAPKPEAANIDRETLTRLAALGYIGAPVSTKARRTSGPLADPKDKQRIFESIQQAGGLITQEKYDQAVEILESVLREESLIPQAMLMLAQSYIKLDRKEEAKEQFDSILKDDPESIQALIGLANLLQEEGKKEDVIALCKQTLSLDERNVQAYTILGEVYMDEKDYSQALPHLEKAAEIQPKLTRNRLNLGACFVGLRQYDKAESLLQEIVGEHSKFPMAHYHLGLLYEEQKRWGEAKKAYSEEVELYPENFMARFNLGKLLYRLGDREGYLEQMQEVIRIAPKKAEGYLFLARGLLQKPGDVENVLELIQQGLSLAESSELKALGYYLLADIYTRKNQPGKVQEALKKARSYTSK